MYSDMSDKLKNLVPEIEIKYKAELAYKIHQLKLERNALILGHNYMEPALYYSIPDFVGDSLELARKSAKTDKDIIIFCGVKFMAETAKILNPDKKVLIPSLEAECSLASSITVEDVRALKKKYPGVPVVTYINTYAEIKAESDICCTSGNAAHIIESLKADEIIFIPDEYLARNVARETNKKIIFPANGDNNIDDSHMIKYDLIGWKGRCEVHEKFTVEDIKNVRNQYPHAAILSHPECSPEVVEASDFSGSTSAMIKYVGETDAQNYLLLTECSMGDNIVAANPHKKMISLCSVRCQHMNRITLEDTYNSLVYDQYEIQIPEMILQKAYKAVNNMMEMV